MPSKDKLPTISINPRPIKKYRVWCPVCEAEKTGLHKLTATNIRDYHNRHGPCNSMARYEETHTEQGGSDE